MKKLAEAIPFLLLVGLVPYFYYNTPNLSQSIIILGVCALCGYRYYCMEQVKPNYVEMFQEQFDSYKSQRDEELNAIVQKHQKAMVHLEHTVKELNSNYGKITMEQTRKGSISKFEF